MPEQVLRDAEDSAGKPRENDSDGAVDEARAAESGDNGTTEEGGFLSNVSGRGDNKAKKGKFKGRGLKKFGPLVGILGLLICFAVLMGLAQSVMPFAVVNRMIEEYNTNGISAVLRSDNILDLQLSGNSSMFAMTDYQKECLENNNILQVDYGGGTILAYQKPHSEKENSWNIAHGSQQANVSVTDAVAEFQTKYPNQSFSGTITVVSIQDAMEDSDFKVSYTTASKTWRGGNSGWYDTLSTLGESIHGYDRSRWYKYNAGKADAVAAGFRSLAKSAIFSATGETTLKTGGTRFDEGDVVDDKDGKVLESAGEKTTNAAESLAIAARFTNIAKTGSTVACSIVEGLMGVQTMISTYQRIQKLNLASGYIAAVQGVQAGDSNGAAMHEYNQRLTEHGTDPETGESTKTAMESAYADNAFNGTPINASDPSIQNVNVETTLTSVSKSSSASGISGLVAKAIGDASGLLNAFETCNYVNGTLSFISAGLTIASIVTFGISGLINIGWKAVAKGAIIAVATSLGDDIARYVIKNVGKMLVQDIATDWLGEDLGNALFSSSNSLLQANHQIGGGSPGNYASVLGFKQSQARVIAEEAEYQRAVRSPLDVNSQYTFLGSIVQSLIPLATSSNVGGIVKNISSLVSNSAVKLTPSASATAIGFNSKASTIAENGDCPTMDRIEVRGDVSCTPLVITDETSMDYSPQQIIEYEQGWGNIEVNGDSITIKDGTNLANYINYCNRRTSSWGVADANIAEAIENNDNSFLGKVLDIAASDVSNIIKSANAEGNLPWTIGQACIASESNKYWCENRIHQRFIEDQRIYADINPGKEGAVAAYIRKDLEKNPLDNSYEGILARYSGMTKNDVIATLQLMDAITYVANYNPEERTVSIALANDSYEAVPEAPTIETENRQNPGSVIAMEPKYIIYNPLRNRTNAIL